MTAYSKLFVKPLAAAVLCLAATAASTALAQSVQVSNAWMRPTVPGQQATGAYMSLKAPTALQLVGVSTPAAGVAEVHEMKMEGDVMKMREIQRLDLPAGKTIDLKPGGLHVMLMDLKQPFVKGTQVPMTLRFKDAKGVETTQQVMLQVAMTPPAAAAKK